MWLTLFSWCNISEDVLKSSDPVKISERLRDQAIFGKEVGHGQGISTNASCELVSGVHVIWAGEYEVVDVLSCTIACGLRAFWSG
jgi:hypothetical protein